MEDTLDRGLFVIFLCFMAVDMFWAWVLTSLHVYSRRILRDIRGRKLRQKRRRRLVGDRKSVQC